MSVTAVNQTASKDAIANVEVIKSATKKVIKKDYILNELDAMKKKLNFQYRDPAISIEGEAKNGATININLKTSLFEYAKAKLITAFNADSNIVETIQTATATATSKYSGNADVEYQLETVYKANEHQHKVKITCYTTTCKITVTNMEGKSEPKIYLDNKCNARYFAECFLEPFLKKALTDFPNLDDKFLPMIRNEIDRLQNLENQSSEFRKPVTGSNGGVAKCVFKYHKVVQWFLH